MALGNWTFSICVPDVDETTQPGESPADYVLRLAQAKARAAACQEVAGPYIVAADTAVVDDGVLLGKPVDAADAAQMLKRLRGHSHEVYTGLATLDTDRAQPVTELCVTEVPMRTYTDAEIDAYVTTGDPFDKAGAYAIQSRDFRPVDRLNGCYASVMGLPLCHLLRALARLDAPPQPDLPAHCQQHLKYACPVSSAILRGEQVG
jgi:nucleoside triphosphate pyrophosphatase